jgi:hypothetical protein
VLYPVLPIWDGICNIPMAIKSIIGYFKRSWHNLLILAGVMLLYSSLILSIPNVTIASKTGDIINIIAVTLPLAFIAGLLTYQGINWLADQSKFLKFNKDPKSINESEFLEMLVQYFYPASCTRFIKRVKAENLFNSNNKEYELIESLAIALEICLGVDNRNKKQKELSGNAFYMWLEKHKEKNFRWRAKSLNWLGSNTLDEINILLEQLEKNL